MAKKESKEQNMQKKEAAEEFFLAKLKEDLARQQLIEYDRFPNIELYMDQVISLMGQQGSEDGGMASLTSSMINNYVKQEVLPRAKGKRYTRDHLVDLTLIVYLKEVLPISSIGELRLLLEEEGDPRWRYEKILQNLSEAQKTILEILPADDSEPAQLILQILQLGLISSISRQIALKLLDFMS